MIALVFDLFSSHLHMYYSVYEKYVARQPKSESMNERTDNTHEDNLIQAKEVPFHLIFLGGGFKLD